MNKSIFEAFLLRTAIPKVKDGAYIPKCLNGETNLLWDCIWRAHRDVLAGYRYVDERFYRIYADQNAVIKVNEIDELLYDLIAKRSCALTSKTLINELYGKYKTADVARELKDDKATTFGAIQKLVNMTLKYIFILQAYGVQDGSLPRVNPQECDCPLDSVILASLDQNETKWTQLDERDYWNIEREILPRIFFEDASLGPISYDFRNWPPKSDPIRRHDK